MTAISSYPFARIFTESHGDETFYIKKIKKLEDVFFMEIISPSSQRKFTWVFQTNWPSQRQLDEQKYPFLCQLGFFKRMLLPNNDLQYFYSSQEKHWALTTLGLMKTMDNEEERVF